MASGNRQIDRCDLGGGKRRVAISARQSRQEPVEKVQLNLNSLLRKVAKGCDERSWLHDMQGCDLFCELWDFGRTRVSGYAANVLHWCVAVYVNLKMRSDPIFELLVQLESNRTGGWKPIFDFPIRETGLTEFGAVAFGDGLQIWENPFDL